jgi:glyoxylase-like metal-dependent hydrolase (beta-lactamase superfamily II)
MKLINFSLIKSLTAITKTKLPVINLLSNLSTKPLINKKMNIVPIEALSDNYMYLLIDEQSRECAAVDPVEPKKLLVEVQRLNLKLTQVLITHHHW